MNGLEEGRVFFHLGAVTIGWPELLVATVVVVCIALEIASWRQS